MEEFGHCSEYKNYNHGSKKTFFLEISFPKLGCVFDNAASILIILYTFNFQMN